MSDAAVDQIEAGITPPGLTVLDYETDGIDPYEFPTYNKEIFL